MDTDKAIADALNRRIQDDVALRQANRNASTLGYRHFPV